MSRRFAGLAPYEGYEDAIVEKKDGVAEEVAGADAEEVTILEPSQRPHA